MNITKDSTTVLQYMVYELSIECEYEGFRKKKKKQKQMSARKLRICSNGKTVV